MAKLDIEIQQMLMKVALFSALSPEEMQAVCAAARIINMEPAQRLFQQGQSAQNFFLVISGEIKLYRLSEDGDEKVIEIIRPGQTFAEAVMFMAGKSYPVNADAISSVKLLAFDNDHFVSILSGSIDTCLRLLGALSTRLHHHLNEIDGITLHNATFRLVTFLLNQLPADVVESPQIYLTTPKHVVASRLSIQPETFSRLLAKLSRDGLIEIQGNHIILTNLSKLRELVDTHQLRKD